jgi:hypothetical protein
MHSIALDQKSRLPSPVLAASKTQVLGFCASAARPFQDVHPHGFGNNQIRKLADNRYS